MKRERRSFDLVDALTDGGQQRYSLRGGAAVSQSTSTPHTLSDKLSSTHREELEIIWNSDKRTPSLASRKAWSVARGIDHKVVNGWFSHKRHHAVHRYGQSVPKGTYELHPGAPKGQHHNTDKLTRTRKERDLTQLKIKRERASSPGVVSRPSSTAPPRNTRPRKKIKIEPGIQIIKHTRAHESVPNPHCLTCTQNSFPSIRSPVHERDDRLFSPATSAHHRTPELSLGHRSSDVDYDADTETLTPLPSGDEGEVQIAGQPSTVFTAGASKVSSLAASSVTRTTLDLLTSFSGQELLFVDPGRSKNGAYTQPKPSPRESKAVKFASSVSLLGDFAASNLPSVNHSGPSLSGSLSTLDRVKQSYNLPPRQFRKSALVNHLKPITGSLPVSLIPNPQAFLSPPFSGPSASTDNTQSSASAVFASVSTHMKNTNARSVLDIPVKYRRLHAYTDFAQNAIRNLPEDSTSHTTFACNVSVAALTQPASSTVASNVASNSLRTSALANSCALIAMDTPSTSVVDDVMPLPLHDHVSTKASDADRSLPIHTPGLLASPSRFRVRDNAPPAHEIEMNGTPAVEATLALLPVKCEPIVLQIPVIPAEVIEAPHATDVATPAHPTSSSAVKKIAIKVEVLSDSDDEPLVVVMNNRRATKENIPAPPRIPKLDGLHLQSGRKLLSRRRVG
ncbi:unnamed protein product [Somion occarium]|uniref:Homeobox domain-containing protein n=1 Tax=Somion occarium TaxID=3059160 RepID=A0ABP1D8X2_9APHY